MRDPVPPTVLWAALAVAAGLALAGPVDGVMPVRVAALGLGALALVPLLGWLRVLSFVPIAAAGLAAAATALLLGLGQAVPVAFLAASVTGAFSAAALTLIWPPRPAAAPALASVAAALAVWGVVLPRVVVRPASQPVLFGIDLTAPRSLGVLAVILLGAAALGLANVARSATGREIAAVGAAPELALRSGADTTGTRLRAGLLAGLCAGWAGALLALAAGALPPLTQLSPGAMVVWLSVAVVGGAGSIGGAVVAALLVGGLAALLGVPEAAVAGLGLVAVVAMGGRGMSAVARPAAEPAGDSAA